MTEIDLLVKEVCLEMGIFTHPAEKFIARIHHIEDMVVSKSNNVIIYTRITSNPYKSWNGGDYSYWYEILPNGDIWDCSSSEFYEDSLLGFTDYQKVRELLGI